MAYCFGALPCVALAHGAVDVVAAAAAGAVAAEVEHAVGLVVEGRDVVGCAVDLRPEVDAFAGRAVAHQRVPYIHAAHAAGAVADEVEDHRAVGQASHGGMCGGVCAGVHLAPQSLRFAPSASEFLGPPYLAAQVGVAHAGACEVEVVGQRVEGQVARVVAPRVEAPAAGLGACQLAAARYACLVDLHLRAVEVEHLAAAFLWRHGAEGHDGVAHAYGAGLAARGVVGTLKVLDGVLRCRGEGEERQGEK